MSAFDIHAGALLIQSGVARYVALSECNTLLAININAPPKGNGTKQYAITAAFATSAAAIMVRGRHRCKHPATYVPLRRLNASSLVPNFNCLVLGS